MSILDAAEGATTTDWISLALTAALVGVTIWYAWHTRSMVKEMAAQREADIAGRRREKSDRAAYSCLQSARDLLAQLTRRGLTAVEPDAFRLASDALKDEAPLIEDPTMRSRTYAVAEVLHVAGFDHEQMDKEQLSVRLVTLNAQGFLKAYRSVLQEYLAERPVSAWAWDIGGDHGARQQYPDHGEAASWIRTVGRREADH